jgi:hypothetical protein
VVNPGTPSITTTAVTPILIGGSITDTAHLAGGVSPLGSITFTAYGPNDATCSLAPVFTSNAIPVNGNGDYTSNSFIPLTAGTYLWIASYSDGANNVATSTKCGDLHETSVVNPGTPSITTTAVTPILIGGSITDTAHLAGGVSPLGSITFTAYGPNDATCSLAPVFTSNAIPVNGNGDYTSNSFIPLTAGTYLWIASYSDGANNVATSTKCGDLYETSVVYPCRPTITTTAVTPITIGGSITDTAHLAGGVSPVGNITFTAYGPVAGVNPTPTCTTVAFTSNSIPVNGDGDYTSNGFIPPLAGTYFWIASFTGGPNNLPASTKCGDLNETSVVNP